MGYDMYVVDDKGETIPDLGDAGYWRRALGSGYRQAKRLEEAGMGSWGMEQLFQEAEAQGFPKRPETVEWSDREDNYVGEGAEEYRKVLLAYLSDRRGAPMGIALWKLCNTNDGWWVTKEECQEALAAWEAAGQPEVDDYDDTIPFLRVAAAYGGFRVY
jgi:hypothetical protein